MDDKKSINENEQFKDDGEIDIKDYRDDLEARSRDRADGFDGLKDFREERREDREHQDTFEVISISPDADRVHNWGVIQFIMTIIIALAIVVYMSIGRQDVYFEAANPYFFCWEGFTRGTFIALLLVLASNTVRIGLKALSVVVEANFRQILNDEEQHNKQI